MPPDLAAALDQLPALVGEAHEPLPGGDELQRPVALLVVAHGVLDGARLAAQGRPVAGGGAVRVAELGYDGGARLAQVLAGQLGVVAVGCVRGGAVPHAAAEGDRLQAAVAADDLAQRQPLLLPPLHVGGVAEGAHHQDAGALLGVRQLGGEDRHPGAKQRGHGALPEQVAVAGVVGVGGDADAGGEQLRTGGGNHQFPFAALHGEGDVVVVAGGGPVLHLGLGHGGTEVDVPHGRRLGRVQVSLAVEVQEAVLGEVAAGVVYGGVLFVPVHRQADGLPHAHERALILLGDQRAQLDEVASRHRPRR